MVSVLYVTILIHHLLNNICGYINVFRCVIFLGSIKICGQIIQCYILVNYAQASLASSKEVSLILEGTLYIGRLRLINATSKSHKADT